MTLNGMAQKIMIMFILFHIFYLPKNGSSMHSLSRKENSTNFPIPLLILQTPKNTLKKVHHILLKTWCRGVLLMTNFNT